MWGGGGDDRHRPPRRRLSDSSKSYVSSALMGLHIGSEDDTQSAASRRDDLSLAYSIDDNKSRASTYISAASEDEHTHQVDYYEPKLPIPVEDPAPPPAEPEPEPEPEEKSMLQSLMESPIQYIFGGNDDDDDVSTLGGFNEGFNDSFRWGDGDNSTIATTPTLKREFRMQQQPTIYEAEEESSKSSHGRASSVDESIDTDDKSGPMPNISYSSRERSIAEQDELTQYTEDFSQYSKEESLGKPKSLGTHSMHSKSERSSASVTFYEESEHIPIKSNMPAAQKAYDFASKSLHSHSSHGMTDEDASRSRSVAEDVSISLSQAFGGDHEEQQSRRSTDQWSQSEQDDMASVQSSRSEAWRRNVRNNKSWRSARSRRQSLGSRSAYSRRSSGTQSTRSVMPEVAQVVTDGRDGPMMTVGMSGRAVVHVKLDHTSDGTIERLSYTTPLVDEPQDSAQDEYSEYFNDEETIATAKKVEWFDFYFARSKFIRTCYTRKCARINALITVGLVLVLTVVVSVVSTISSADGATSQSSTQRATQSSQMAINDLAAPPPLNAPMQHSFEHNIDDWYVLSGETAANENDVPFYFHIPLAGAMVAHNIWSNCLGFTIASHVGRKEVSNTTLATTLINGASFVNVDPTTLQGIDHAASMGLIPSGLPDVLVSPLFGDVITQLYSSQYKAKFMMTMRHPVDRAVAMFENKKNAVNDPNYDPNLASMSLEQFALSGHIENNYVVRILTGKFSGTLRSQDVDRCKELLRRKAVVGIYERMERSLSHIESYFGWSPVATNVLNCQAAQLTDGLAQESVPPLDSGSRAYVLIRQQNLFDITLYEYVKNVLVPFQTEVITRQARARLTNQQ